MKSDVTFPFIRRRIRLIKRGHSFLLQNKWPCALRVVQYSLQNLFKQCLDDVKNTSHSSRSSYVDFDTPVELATQDWRLFDGIDFCRHKRDTFNPRNCAFPDRWLSGGTTFHPHQDTSSSSSLSSSFRLLLTLLYHIINTWTTRRSTSLKSYFYNE